MSNRIEKLYGNTGDLRDYLRRQGFTYLGRKSLYRTVIECSPEGPRVIKIDRTLEELQNSYANTYRMMLFHEVGDRRVDIYCLD